MGEAQGAAQLDLPSLLRRNPTSPSSSVRYVRGSSRHRRHRPAAAVDGRRRPRCGGGVPRPAITRWIETFRLRTPGPTHARTSQLSPRVEGGACGRSPWSTPRQARSWARAASVEDDPHGGPRSATGCAPGTVGAASPLEPSARLRAGVREAGVQRLQRRADELDAASQRDADGPARRRGARSVRYSRRQRRRVDFVMFSRRRERAARPRTRPREHRMQRSSGSSPRRACGRDAKRVSQTSEQFGAWLERRGLGLEDVDVRVLTEYAAELGRGRPHGSPPRRSLASSPPSARCSASRSVRRACPTSRSRRAGAGACLRRQGGRRRPLLEGLGARDRSRSATARSSSSSIRPACARRGGRPRPRGRRLRAGARPRPRQGREGARRAAR